jgi:hypothetical protein
MYALHQRTLWIGLAIISLSSAFQLLSLPSARTSRRKTSSTANSNNRQRHYYRLLLLSAENNENQSKAPGPPTLAEQGIVELATTTSTTSSQQPPNAVVVPTFLSQGEIDPANLNVDLSDPQQTRVILYIILSLIPVLFLIPFMLGSRELIPLDALPPVDL